MRLCATLLALSLMLPGAVLAQSGSVSVGKPQAPQPPAGISVPAPQITSPNPPPQPPTPPDLPKLQIELPEGVEAMVDALPVGDEPPSLFDPIDFPPSTFEPVGPESTFGAAGGESVFGLLDIEPELRERTETILSEFGAVSDGDSILFTLPGDVLFDFDQYDIRADARPVLDRLAEALMPLADVSITITGHTDWMGSDAYNQTLSERRANAVRDWLAGLGVDADLIETEGRGESEPVASNARADGSDDPEGRQLNRRVVFTVQGHGS